MRISLLMIMIFLTVNLTGNPKIKLTEKFIDFGSILPSSTHKHTFVIKNVGTSDLKITKVKPGCGCTITKLSKNIIKPGDSANLNIVYKAPGFDSLINKGIAIHSNDTKNPLEDLRVKASVIGNYKVSVDSVNLKKVLVSKTNNIKLNNIMIGETRSFSFLITPTRKKPFKPDRIKYNQTFLTIKYKKVDEQNPLTSYKFDAVYDPTTKFPPRRISDKIFIYPNKDNDNEVMTISLHGQIEGLISQSRKNFTTSIKQGDTSKKKVKLIHKKKEKFNIIKIDSNNPLVSTEAVKISDHEYDIIINLKKGSIKRTERVLILIHTDNPQQKVMRVFGIYQFTPN